MVKKQRVSRRGKGKPGLHVVSGGGKHGVTNGTSKGVTPPVVKGGAVVGVSSDARVGSSFPIVGIGASAGGLDAFTQLLKELPVDSGMAFVLIQHLDPVHKSFLGEVLSKTTRMRVSQAKHREVVEPNRVYVVPPDADISIQGKHLLLVSRKIESPQPHLHLPIDTFFAALAAERGGGAIGVVLSGTASDGTEGLRAIKAGGGITFAQDPRTAKFASMPQSAIEAAVVDFVLPIPDLARELVRLGRHPYVATSAAFDGTLHDASTDEKAEATVLTRIMNTVKAVVGVDFKEYKSPTFERRLARRMALRRIEGRENYLTLLRREADEVRALCEDTLIHVSSFFRDPEVFDTLKLAVFPEILKHKAEGAPIRIWVAGCSTGEEVYSVAMTLLEFLGELPHPIQIFGSDISELAVQTARAGRYADGAMRGISDEQRRRFFTKVDTGYRINKGVRDLCVFVRHDLARDPPFSKLDLVSCRNVLIYFDQVLQKRVVPTFHYSLNQSGFLLLGRTEDISGFGQLFRPVAKTSKIFARSGAPSSLRFAARSERHLAEVPLIAAGIAEHPRRAGDVWTHLDNLLLARYAPPGVLINEKMEILQFRGQTGAYLQPAPGEPQSNIVKMARPGLLSKLRVTLARARKEMAPVRTEGVEIDQHGFTRFCDIVVLPFAGLPDLKEQLFVVLFEEAASARPKDRSRPAKRLEPDNEKDARRIPKLEHELSATTEYLHSLIEEHSRTNDDLGSANEELVSGNEELQSLNEELETAKEELQSTNEELTTVNDELHNRNLEVGQINGDLVALLNAVDIPIVILDKARHIRRFTAQARSILNVLATDIGRLFDDIKPNIDVPDLDRQIAEVIATFVGKESEVQDRDGRWYRMQIRPHKTADDSIDGAIVSMLDIDSLKHHLSEAQQAKEAAERADRAKDQFLAVLSHELRTPLTALLMQTQLLRQVGADSEKRDRACDAIERSTKMQAQLIDDLLDVSRIVTGKMKVDLQPVELVPVIEGALDSLVAVAESKSIMLKSSLDRSLGQVAGDRTRLEQVVLNLLANAIKFTPKGGRVDVLLERAGGLAHLKVSDTGMGIEADFLPRIFNRLTQKDSSSTRPHSGLGLGLAIVRHLVDAHGGSIRAESPGAGAGSTFHITLPILKKPSQALPVRDSRGPSKQISQASPSTTAGRLTGRRVLVLEDDADIREALAEMLTRAGATVGTAESSASAMSLLQEFQPDVLICDIALPVEDGYAFIHKVRALGAAKGGDTPALALTALAAEGDRRRALAEGFQMQLVKPVDMDHLADAVAELLKRGHQIAPVEQRYDRSTTTQR